jgi:exodeoxyribonuclease III
VPLLHWGPCCSCSGLAKASQTAIDDAVKIATFNINNVNRRLSNLLDWLNAAKPDVVCIQELKAADREFPIAAIESAGYGAAWCGQRTWNGVAILARDAVPVVTHRSLPGDAADSQARYLEAAINGVLIASIYAPNGNPQPGPKFDYKLAWLDRLAEHARTLIEAHVPAVLAGDYNVVPTPFDIYPTKSWDNDALVQPESRERFRRLIEQGWIDAIRSLHRTVPMYTFWDYKRGRWGRDAGLRIDHLLVGPGLSRRISEAGVDKAIRGEAGASDHAPVWVLLKDSAGKSRRAGAV